MNRRTKIIGIILALAFPILLVPFARWYVSEMKLSREKNRPHPPAKMFAQGTMDIVNIYGEKERDSVYHTVPDLKLETQSGDSLELDSLRGNIYVADFFYATCPGICPKMNNSLERVQRAFIKDDNIKIVSFTVDPARDTMNVLRHYANEHDAIPGKWYFLRNSKENVYKLARDGFFVTARENPDGGADAFSHSERLVLVDQQGNIRGFYSGVDSESVNKMMGDMVLLLRENDHGYSFADQKKLTKKLF